MNYTDRWFEFPIRVYDGFEYVKTMIREDKSFDADAENAQPIESDWIVGIAAVLPENIIGWSDNFSKLKSVEDVEREGFDITMVETKQGDMMCVWKRDKFKKKLNEFMEKIYTQQPSIQYVQTNTAISSGINTDSINKEEIKD